MSGNMKRYIIAIPTATMFKAGLKWLGLLTIRVNGANSQASCPMHFNQSNAITFPTYQCNGSAVLIHPLSLVNFKIHFQCSAQHRILVAQRGLTSRYGHPVQQSYLPVERGLSVCSEQAQENSGQTRSS
jgi:hypothetical protein